MSSGPATATPAAGGGGEQDLDAIWDEELLRNMWQTAEDFGERRRIRARMYRLRELRLREMVQNDEESLGTLTTTEGEDDMDDDEESMRTMETSLQTSDKSSTSTRRSSTIEVQLSSSEDQADGDSQAIDSRIKKAGQERSTRYQLIKDKLNTESDSDALVSVTKQGYTLQNNALAADGYSSIKNKETRDSLSPTRYRTGNQATEEDLDSEEALALLAETENVVKALQRAGKTVKVIKSEIPVRRDTKSRPQVRSPSPKKGSPTRTSKIATKMDTGLTEEFGRLHSYLKGDSEDKRQILVNEEEEEMTDEFGNKVKMFVTTTKDKDGKEFTTRRTARTTKVVENESDIDEILIGNPDHEVLERDVSEEVGKDGSKIKVITETRRRPDGIEYTTKNVLKTSKIFDYDHPEDVSYCESDELISTSEKEETDECGATIRIVTETRRKCDGTEYTTKKVYKTSKCSSRITPSDDDEIINTKESEEKDKDGNVTRIVIETRRTASGEEYTHRQVSKCRRMTLTGVELQEGMPMMDNDDMVLDKKEKKEKDENGAEITVVTETRRRKDGTKYTFDYILRSFTGSEAQVKSMPVKSAGASNIKVSDEDELLKEEVKEEEQKDGSTLKTIIERRRAKDGTEYLRHRIMRIPKIPEPQLTVGTPNDEVLQNDVEEMEYNGTRIKSVTERRRSSLTGLQYTLRRMSKTYQQMRRPSTVPGDEVLDENVTEEEGDDGTIIKSVIRRYQRRDGTIYTTHHVNKSFTAPTHVVIEDDDSELIDQTMDQKETDDGYIIKTVLETYQRSDGVQYTIERSEKTDKNSTSVMYTKDYPNQPVELIVPSNDDIVLSQEVEEHPDDEGHVIKVITEERQRSNGSQYTTKTTMTIAATLVPEQETSYVVIKPDEGMEESELLPCMKDELVYTRKREETDHEGNPITVVIETRKSKTTGEMYNITKRVFTTDVLVTDKGEKVINRKTQSPRGTAPRSSGDKLAPSGTVSSMKNRLASKEKKDLPKEKEKPRLIRVNTADRRKLFENVADKPAAKTTKTINVSPKDKPSLTAKVRIGKRDTTVEEVNAKNIQLDSRYKSTERPNSRSSKPDESKREPASKKKPEEKKIVPSRRSPTEASPSQTPSRKAATPTRPSPKESPDRTSKAPTRRARSPVSRPSPKPSRDTSPNGGRQCCNRTHGSGQSSPTSSSPAKRTVPTKTNSRDKDTPKVNGDQPSTRRSPTGSRTRPSELVDSPRRGAPGRTPSEKNLKAPKEPIVSLPQTPMTEDIKSYPDSPTREEEPKIEDVSEEPDLPHHQIHRPSIVREPSEYFGLDPVPKVPSDSDEDVPSKSRKDSQPKDSDSDDNKKKSKAYTRKNSTSLMGGKTSPQPESPRRGTGNVTDRYRRFDKDEDVKSRKISLETRDSVSLKRSIFERDDKKEPKEPLMSSRTRPDTQAPTPKAAPSYENRVPVEEPLIVPRYFHPLGEEKENEKPKRPSLDSPCDMTSPKLIMRLTSQDQNKPKDDSPSRKSSRPDDSPKRRPSREISEEPESRRSDSKEGSPAPFNKEGSPFCKEGSPSRFMTGRPIDQGVNTNKIKKLERSLSGKVTYDDLEGTRNQLPTYLETIESITDVTVLQTMLEEAKTYEERRVIRTQIRHAKKGAPTQPAPSSNTSHRFTTPLRRKESPDTRTPSSRPSSTRPSDRSPTRSSTRPSDRSPTRSSTRPSDRSPTRSSTRPSDRSPSRSSTRPSDRSPTRSTTRPSDRSPTRSSSRPSDNDTKTAPTSLPSKPTERTSPGRDSPSRLNTSSSPDRDSYTRPSLKGSITRDRPSSVTKRTPRTEPVSASDPSSPRKTSDPTAPVPAPAGRKPSREEGSPSRSSNPDASRDGKEPEPSDDDLPAKRPTDRLTNGTSRRLTSRRTSDDDSKLSKTERTTQLTRRDTRESTLTTKTTEVSDSEEVKETKTTSRSLFSRRGSDDKKFTRRDTSDKKSVLSRKDSGDKKTLFTRKDSSEPKTPSSRTKTPEKTSTPSSRTPYSRPADRPSQRQPGKTSAPETSEIYSEPLRHQGTPKRTPGNKQTDVEKIVSPYGVGPTDENGLPLFGLRALKRRNQQPGGDPTPASEPEKPKDFEPTDASGRPLFGLKALAATTTDTRETASVTKETSVRKTSVSKTQRKTSRNEDDDNKGGSSSSPASSASSSPSHSDEEDEEYPDDVDSVIHASTRRTQTSTHEEDEEVIQRRSQPLKDIIKLHEKIVKEPAQPAEETPRSKPKKVLRSNFEPSPEANEPKQAHKTWDVDADLQTRALNMKNIISRHESIAKEPEETEPKTPKKLTGILKKTSTSSVTEAQYAASSVSATTVDTSDFMESMTDDQIAKLSEEFDRRAQDDGIINGTSRGTTPSRSDTSPDRDRLRKTSYTEIKLSQPSQEGNTPSQQTSNSSSFSITRSNNGTNGYSSSRQTASYSNGGVELEDGGRSFLQDRSKVSGFADVMGRMAATDAVEGSAESDEQARSLLNRFLGAQVLLTGVESMMANSNGGGQMSVTESRSSSSATEEKRSQAASTTSGDPLELVKGVDINSEFDEDTLRKLLDSCDAYEDRRKVRQRLKNITASAKGGVSGSGVASTQGASKRGGARDSDKGSSSSSSLRTTQDVATVNSWLADNFPDHQTNGHSGPRSDSRSNSQASTFSSSFSSQSSKMTKVSPFNKFQQLDAQQPTTRRASGGGAAAGGGPLFALSTSLKSSANSIKDVLLTWCQCRTRDYKGIKIENFSTSWNDGMAFCALIHHFYPDAFDFDKLDPKNRRYNFDLAFRIADERAGVMALLDVEDMVIMKKPDWKCVFTYIQSLYKRLKDE